MDFREKYLILYLVHEKTLRVIQKPKTMPYKMAASKGKRISGKHTEISRIDGRHGATTGS